MEGTILFAHTDYPHRRYGSHKLDYSYCITGNSSISQPVEINITFLHITYYTEYLDIRQTQNFPFLLYLRIFRKKSKSRSFYERISV